MTVILINRDTNEVIKFSNVISMIVVNDEILIMDKNYNFCSFPLNDWRLAV